MTFTIKEGNIYVPIKLDKTSAKLLAGLEGRKKWLKNSSFMFEISYSNINFYNSLYPNNQIDIEEHYRTNPSDNPLFEEFEYEFKTKPYQKQIEGFERSKRERAFALLMDQGTGKTKVTLDKAGYLFSVGEITGLLVVSLPGVHLQWAETEAPKHLGVPFFSYAWDKKSVPYGIYRTDRLAIFSTYIHAIARGSCLEECEKFIDYHKGRVLLVIDESTSIKNDRSLYHEKACFLGGLCDYRMILTGTPQPNKITDLYGQYMFLGEHIIGCKYRTTFISEYCEVDSNRNVIGAKSNESLSRLAAKLAPYTFRVTKEEMLDLPDKIYTDWLFDMSQEQKRHISELKSGFMTSVGDFEEQASVQNGVSLLTRIQQISCGWITLDTKEQVDYNDNPRIEALNQLLFTLPEKKVIIWARYTKDIENIAKVLGDKCVTYYGATEKKTDRPDAIKQFMDPNSSKMYFVANPTSAGVGLNLQGVCHDVVYYSSSFSALDRWQSEDRSHRIGTIDSVTYYDLIAKGSVDRRIIANLKRKKSVSELLLSEIMEIIENEDD